MKNGETTKNVLFTLSLSLGLCASTAFALSPESKARVEALKNFSVFTQLPEETSKNALSKYYLLTDDKPKLVERQRILIDSLTVDENGHADMKLWLNYGTSLKAQGTLLNLDGREIFYIRFLVASTADALPCSTAGSEAIEVKLQLAPEKKVIGAQAEAFFNSDTCHKEGETVVLPLLACSPYLDSACK